MLRVLLAALLLTTAGTALAQQGEATVTSKELPPPASPQTTQTQAEPPRPQPPTQDTTTTATETPPQETSAPALQRPSESQRSEDRGNKRIAAFWFIIPGR